MESLGMGHNYQVEDILRKHNSNHKGFTANIGDWKLVYSESFCRKMMQPKEKSRLKDAKEGH
jgi:putative endonuclease